jgi:hypothetical protein
MARRRSCILAGEKMGDPSAITAMHSARPRPGTVSAEGARSNAPAVVASFVRAKWKLKIGTGRA